MKTARYYRCDNKEILAVFDQVQEERNQLQKVGSALSKSVSELTGQECHTMFSTSLDEFRVAGVRFEEFTENLSINFRKPQKGNSFITWPKVKADKEIKSLFKDLPKVDRKSCWRSLGKNWGDFLFAPLGYIHKKGEYLYVATSLDLTEKLTEITGGEYQQIENEAA